MIRKSVFSHLSDCVLKEKSSSRISHLSHKTLNAELPGSAVMAGVLAGETVLMETNSCEGPGRGFLNSNTGVTPKEKIQHRMTLLCEKSLFACSP